jgi:hypothetical protein
MAVIINELEVVLEPPPLVSKQGGQMPVPQKPQLKTQDLLSIVEREQRNRLRLQAH